MTTNMNTIRPSLVGQFVKIIDGAYSRDFSGSVGEVLEHSKDENLLIELRDGVQVWMITARVTCG